MGNYHTGYFPGMTEAQVAQQDDVRQKEWMKRQTIRRMESIRYEVLNENKFRAKNHSYINPLTRGDITIKEYNKLKKQYEIDT
jgi:hypothetical protein